MTKDGFFRKYEYVYDEYYDFWLSLAFSAVVKELVFKLKTKWLQQLLAETTLSTI